MSYTTVKALWPGEKVEDLEELHNAFGTAPPIWNYMCIKYLGMTDGLWLMNSDKLWPLWKRADIPKNERAVLMMTYDMAYVTKKDYSRAASDIRKWLLNQIGKYTNHWPRIATIFESNPDVPAIGLYCTSVSEDPFIGEWDEDKEEHKQIDWETAYDLYAELDKLEGEAKEIDS